MDRMIANAFNQLRRMSRLFVALAASGLLASCASNPRTIPIDASMLGAVEKEKVYTLRPGDVIQIDVFQEPIMTTRQRILGDGSIAVGLIGKVIVGGLSVEQASNKIAALLNKNQLVNPQVTITVLAYAPRRFTVWGQVKAPGSYIIPPEETITLPQAIALSGGNTTIGSLKKVIVTRTVRGETVRIRVNALSEDGSLFRVEEGDVIFVTETVF